MDEGGIKRKITKIKNKKRTYNFLQRYITNACNVFFTTWVRCIIQIYNGYYRIILDGGYNILLNFRMLLVMLYITYEIFK